MLKHLPKNPAVRNAFYAASWSEYVMLELIDIPINWKKKMEKKKEKGKRKRKGKKILVKTASWSCIHLYMSFDNPLLPFCFSYSNVQVHLGTFLCYLCKCARRLAAKQTSEDTGKGCQAQSLFQQSIYYLMEEDPGRQYVQWNNQMFAVFLEWGRGVKIFP